MKDMEELVILKIQTFDGDIEIPFMDLEMLDKFTVRYKNKEDLITGLLSMLNLAIDRQRIREVYVYYEYIKNDKLRKKNTKVKYNIDNFDMKTLSDYLKGFLKEDHDMIRQCGVRKIRSKGMCAFIRNERDIENYEIEYAVDKYFEGAPYGVYRKIYFFLKDYGVKVNKNRVVREEMATINRGLSKFHSDDEYIQSMLMRARSEEDYDKVLDELSKIDLEDLGKLLINPHFGLFDGVNNDKPYTLEDLYDLQMCTGMEIDDLYELIVNSLKKGPKR